MSAGCRTFRSQLPWFVGGDLDRVRAASVARHLADCCSCRRDAASLQQAGKALGRLREVEPAGVDDAMFAALQRDTLAAVEREVVADGERRIGPALLGRVLLGRVLLGRALWAAAAVLLFGVGWWSVRTPDAPSLLDRPMPRAIPIRDTDARVVPYAGPRAELRPLGYRGDRPATGEDAVEEPADEELLEAQRGAGMMRRWQLRTLEQELDGRERGGRRPR
ncbi:MAG: hypothetical protein KDE27_15790 [Planctomycetes bacterium]|nr:hypothetical protein [Planctomycetota bacterium]